MSQTVSCPECHNCSFLVRIKEYGGAIQITFLCDRCNNEIEWLVRRAGIEDLALKRYFQSKE